MAAVQAPPIDDTLLVGLATRIARARGLWEPHVRFQRKERLPVRLFTTDRCEAWVIGWLPGQGVELHDHGDAAGALAVVDGTLVDLVATDRRLRPRSLPAGTTVSLPLGLVHDVVAPGPAPATSIHVYSPPLTQMSYYDDPGGIAVRSASVLPEPAVLTPKQVARALHPSSVLGV
ncbi:MAG: cysteine dioxygenase family protein [Acidimicrobiia bacterium]|nr:cysteine dioxygenase family protein [Acidimicrobiia bacterium]